MSFHDVANRGQEDNDSLVMTGECHSSVVSSSLPSEILSISTTPSSVCTSFNSLMHKQLHQPWRREVRHHNICNDVTFKKNGMTNKRKTINNKGSALTRQRMNRRPACLVFNNINLSALFLSILLLCASDIFSLAMAESPSSEKELPNRCPIRIPNSIDRPPLVIGHRGASFSLPEHTIPAYRLALELGADYIEPDLVPTRDGHLVSYHGLDLGISTNVESIFPGRKRTMAANNKTGYFVQDFTLQEIKLIKVRQRVPNRTKDFDDLFDIPSLSEIIDLLYDWNVNVRPRIGINLNTTKTRSRPGLYAELKYPDLLQEDANISMADLFVQVLKSHPKSTELFFDKTECELLKFDEYLVPPLVVQSFGVGALKYARELFEEQIIPSKKEEEQGEEYIPVEQIWRNGLLPPFILLISKTRCFENYKNQEADEDFWFEAVEARIDGVGPDKACLITDRASLGRDFMETARLEHHLVVHPWTERMELSFVTGNHGFATAEDELMYMICVLKIDGIFAENVDLAVRVGMKGCDDYVYNGVSYGKNKKENESGKTLPPGTKVCYETQKEEVMIVGAAFGVFGLFLGIFMTCWISVNRGRRSVRRQLRDSSSVVPSASDEDHIDAQRRRQEVDGDLEML